MSHDTLPVTATPPDLTGDLAADAVALASFAAAHEDVLAGVPPEPGRDPGARQVTASSVAAVRTLRREFLARHADAVYDTLTANRTRRVRLPELVFAAAERYPGLTPTRERLATDLARVQAERDGLEIDQGIFCGAILRSPTAGRHLIDTMLRPTERALELADRFAATGLVELASVVVERHGYGTHVTFRNADCLNAEDNRLIGDLETAVDLALLDDRTRVGVLRGGEVDHPRYRGRRVFSAGINLKHLRDGRISFVDFLLGRELGYVHKILRGLLTGPDHGAWTDRTVQKPWVAAVDSFAIGGGMQLLLVVDRVIAEDDAYFSLPAADEGIVPGLGNLRLTRLVGGRLARQMILGGRRIQATDPQARLVCDDVVALAGMADAIERAVRELSAPAVAANRLMLTLAEEPVDSYREYLAEFAVAQAARAYRDDVLANVERWRGEA